ncbi:MAG: cytidylate kinase-like family protein [Chloroflexota bacterium]
MSIVTIRGQMGSGAPEIGELIAEKLHADYVDREIIARVAELLKVHSQEVMDKEMPPGSLLGRIAEALGRSYDGGISNPGVWLPPGEIPLGDIRYLPALEAIIKELADGEPIVIRGRGSQFILKDHPGAFHVLAVAPAELRVSRVMETLKLDEKAAKKEISSFDSSRRAFVKRYFQADLEDPVHYDLVINTGHLTFDAAASIIVNSLPFKQGT